MSEEILKQIDMPKMELTREKADVLIELIRKMPEYPLHSRQDSKMQKEWRDQITSFFAKLGLCIRYIYSPKDID